MTVEGNPVKVRVLRLMGALFFAPMVAFLAGLVWVPSLAAAQIPPFLQGAPAAVAPPLAAASWTRRLPPTGAWLGGLSGLAPLPQEGRVRRLLALSDRGFVVELRIGGSVLVALPRGRVTRGTGRGRDAEALVPIGNPPIGWWIAFERDHRLHRLGLEPDGPVVEAIRLSGAEHLPSNSGMEGLARLLDGSLLAIAEGASGGSVPLWLLNPQGQERARFRLPVADGFRPVEAVGLPDGGLLVLERRYVPILGFASRARLWAQQELQQGLRTGMLSWGQPGIQVGDLPAANWEGLILSGSMAPRITQASLGEASIYLVSDNNFDARIPTWVARRPAPIVTVPR